MHISWGAKEMNYLNWENVTGKENIGLDILKLKYLRCREFINFQKNKLVINKIRRKRGSEQIWWIKATQIQEHCGLVT